MKVLKYRLMEEADYGTEEHPDLRQAFYPVTLPYSVQNEEIAKKEAYNSEYTVEDDE